MNAAVESAATAFIAPKVFRAVRLRWIVYGVAAYYGLRYLSKKGIFQKQADVALNMIDRGVGMVKEQVGLGSSATQSQTQTYPH